MNERNTRAIRLPMARRAIRPLVVVLMTMVVAGLRPGGAEGATFTVDPTQIFIAGRTTSVLLTLRNESQQPLRFQLSVFAWSQSASGEMQLEPTEDIVFFPALLTLEPNETRRVRVGSATRPEAREKTYRIFVEELPPLEPEASGVRVLTKMGIPIFVRPPEEESSAQLTGLERRDRQFHFTLANNGTVHVVPQKVTVRGLADSGETFAQELESWYVLAGGRREFSLNLPESECSRVTSLVVDIEFASGSLQERLQTPGGVCSN
jgi:fimbrial chaperone protein